MSRRPEIGNVQLYPNRPLKQSDKNGYQLKFYCPIRRTRIRKNCGTRDRREARRILRECQKRLLDGKYTESGGAISEATEVTRPQEVHFTVEHAKDMSWQDAYYQYRIHREKRQTKESFEHAQVRLGIAERIFHNFYQERRIPEVIMIRRVMTLELLEYLQERLLAGEEGQFENRSPNTVNSYMSAVMTFARFCAKRGWIDIVPDVERLDSEDVMKGRPITGEEYQRMLAVTPDVVGKESAESWKFAISVIWESGFRVGDLMDFCWDDDRHICPQWSTRRHPTIQIPSSQKNGKLQVIPMLPGLSVLLQAVPKSGRSGWIINPQPVQYELEFGDDWFQPSTIDLERLASLYSNVAIASACGVSDTTVRKWLKRADIKREREFKCNTGTIPEEVIGEIRERATRRRGRDAQRRKDRLTKDRVSRVISKIGEAAGIVVRQADVRTGARRKYASAHDIRRGCANRLINAGVSAETLKVVMRHEDFATTERHYGAIRSAQSAAAELVHKLPSNATSDALVGGLMGGNEKAPQLSAEELLKLKSLLERI